ncbi:hypothetical protein Gotur_018497, partial [Gossypium turneri]
MRMSLLPFLLDMALICNRQVNILRKPLMLLLRLTVRKESTCLYNISMMSK